MVKDTDSKNIIWIVDLHFFSSFLISSKTFLHNFNGDIFLLLLGVSNTFGLGAVLGVV